MERNQGYIKGRGAQSNVNNPFNDHVRSYLTDLDDGLEYVAVKNQEIIVRPKTIVNKVDSFDVGMSYSLNPYQGCEHGCIYCYARNSHTYWGYDAGLDFETKLLIKKSAPQLLEARLSAKSWKPDVISLSGNTDCYQPIEKKYEITRGILEVLLKYRNPVSIITKNSLILRDLDILKKLNEHSLVQVFITVTTLEESTRRLLEPRTASVAARLKTIQALSQSGIPVGVMMGPIIPSFNDHEILNVAKNTARLGAKKMVNTIISLNGQTGEIFTEWLNKTMPDRATRILNQIKACHQGKLNDSRLGVRKKGEGKYAENIHQQIQLAKKMYFKEEMPPLSTQHFMHYTQQLKLDF